MHPLVLFVYIALILIITMFTMHPAILGASFALSILVGVGIYNVHFLRRNIISEFLILIFCIGIQPLFSHNGATPLFYINDSAVYLESYIWGVIIALMLISVINWFSVWVGLMDSEKMMYLFGKAAPTLGMIFSMILRFIPLMRRRYREIHEGQLSMLQSRYNKKKMSLLDGIKLRVKELSILISWSLENSLETSNSMEARGYGLPGRTSYHRFRFGLSELISVCYMCITGITTVAIIIKGSYRIYFVPKVYVYPINVQGIIGVISLVMLCIYPIIIKIVEKIRHERRGYEKY